LFEKMVATDPEAPTQEEQNEQGVSKQRFLSLFIMRRDVSRIFVCGSEGAEIALGHAS